MMFNGQCDNSHNNNGSTNKSNYPKSHENILEPSMTLSVLLGLLKQVQFLLAVKYLTEIKHIEISNKDATSSLSMPRRI